MDDNSTLYENLLKATDNLKDITFTRYATVTKLLANHRCNVTESENTLSHTDVPILNGLGLKTGDTVIVGFANNSLYNPFVIGKIGDDDGSGGRETELDEYADDIIYDMNRRIDLEVSTPTGKPCMIDALLTFDGSAYPNRPIELVNGGVVVDTKNTDSNGAVRFTIEPQNETEYTIRYNSNIYGTIVKTISHTTQTITLTGTSDVYAFDKSSLIRVEDGKLLSDYQFQSQRGKAYIKEGWNNSKEWSISFTAYTGNTNQKSGYVLIRTDIDDISVANQLKNCIGIRSNGNIDLYTDTVNERVIIGYTSLSALNWRNGRINITVARHNSDYTVTFDNGSKTEVIQFNWTGFDNYKGALNLVLTVDCSSHGDCNKYLNTMELLPGVSDYYNCATVTNTNNNE